MSASFVYNLENVSYDYNNKPALVGVNLKVCAAERLMLLGPNGCGKSTLQKIMAGLIFSSFGKVVAFDRVISADSMGDKDFSISFRRKVGFVFQNSDVQLFCTNVLDEVMFGPLSMGISFSEAKERAEEMLDYAGITGLADCSPHFLSGGEKKKVAIAAVLAGNPDVLILDEPTNGLDPRSQRWIINAINELNDCGKTIISATHYLDLVPELADRVLVLGENHQIIADDRPENILANRDILVAANLIDPGYHVHFHQHGQSPHVHNHGFKHER